MSLAHVAGLECLVCGKLYGVADIDYVCPDHGPDGVVDVLYDYERIRGDWSREALAADPDRTMWRYRPLLPVAADATVPPLPVGRTPMWRAPRVGEPMGLRDVWIKDDGVNPTASLKDRASAVAVVKGAEWGASYITTASTGNAAAALAGVGAAAGARTVMFVPAAAPEPKVAQLLAYGAEVFLVDGSYDDAYRLCLEAADAFGWYNRSTGFNPYMSEGKKTAALEIAEDLLWDAPDAVFVSVGDGCIVGSLYKGFRELVELGWTHHVPRIYGIQATGSDYLTQAWESDEDVVTKAPIVPDTVADSISAGLPRDRIKGLRAVKASDGAFLRVDDDAILAAIPTLAARTGVFAEPAAAAAHAGLELAASYGLVGEGDRIVVLLTGSGLKDVAAARRAVSAAGIEPRLVPPSLDALRAAIEDEAG